MANPLFSLFGNKMGSEAGLLGDLAMSLFGQNQQQPQPVQPQATTDPSQLTGQQPPQAPPPGPASYPTFNAGLQAPVPPPGQFEPQPVSDFASQDTMTGGTGGDRFGAPEAAANPMADMFAVAEETYGLPAGYLSRTAAIESSGNPDAQNPHSSAGGLFQFIDSTASAYGLKNKFDPEEATDAAARLAVDNKNALATALGREPTAAELYLAHQQGAGGAAKLLANPNALASDLVGKGAVIGNGGDPDTMTAGEFAGMWTNKFDKTNGVTMSSSGDGAGAEGGDDSIDYSELEDEVDEWTPEEQNRQARWAGLGAFSKGLGQMSRGDAIDVGDVFDNIVDRQREARERKSEIAKLKIQERIDVRSNKWATEREQRGYEHAETLQEREQGYDTNKVAAAHKYDEGQVEKYKAGVDKVAAESTDPLMKRASQMVQASNYTLSYADAIKELEPDEKSGKLKEFSEWQKMIANGDQVGADAYYKFLTSPEKTIGDSAAIVGQKQMVIDTGDRVQRGRQAVEKAAASQSALDGLQKISMASEGKNLTGPVVAQTATIQNAIADAGRILGIDIPEDTEINTAMQETIGMLSAQMRPMFRAQGEQSNAELLDTVNVSPSMSTSPEGMKFKVQGLQTDFAIMQMKQNALEEYRAANKRPGQEATDVGFDAYWKELKTAGIVPDNFIDMSVETDRQGEAVARMVRDGLLHEGSIVMDTDPKGNKYFRPISAGELQAYAGSLEPGADGKEPVFTLIDHVPYPWEREGAS